MRITSSLRALLLIVLPTMTLAEEKPGADAPANAPSGKTYTYKTTSAGKPREMETLPQGTHANRQRAFDLVVLFLIGDKHIIAHYK